MQSKTYTVNVQENEQGELFIELPDEIIETMNCKEGDVIEWLDNKDGSYTLVKKETEWVMVEAVGQFRMRYMVEVPEGKAEWALDTVACNEAKEFSQEHLGEVIVSHRVVSEEEALSVCRKDNAYVSSWTDDKLKEVFFTRQGEKAA